MPKRGPMTESDKDYIRVQYSKAVSIEEIATALDRRPEGIQKYVKENLSHVQPGASEAPQPHKKPMTVSVPEEERVVIKHELRNSAAWRNLSKEFDRDEQDHFEEEYIKLMSQFNREGVLATEETQIFHAIKYLILISRNFKERLKLRGDIERLEKLLEREYKKLAEEGRVRTKEQRDSLAAIELQIAQLKGVESGKSGEFTKLEERHTKLMESLKGTRDQRIKQIESSKVNFLSLLKQMEQRDFQEIQGRQLGLVQRATVEEMDRLGRPTTYEDGNQDHPILSAETVNWGPKEDEQELKIEEEEEDE